MNGFPETSGGSNKKALIIAIAVVVVLIVGGVVAFFLLRGGGEATPAPVPETPPSTGTSTGLVGSLGSLQVQTVEEGVEASVTVPADPVTGEAILDAPTTLTAAEKEKLGIPATASASLVVKKDPNGVSLVGEITIAPSSSAGTVAGEPTVITVALPSAAGGTVAPGIHKELSDSEKRSFGIGERSIATVTAVPTAGGYRLEFDVDPVYVTSTETGDEPPEYVVPDPGEPAGKPPGMSDQEYAELTGANDAPSEPAILTGCGNLVCEGTETITSCPTDCRLMSEDSLAQTVSVIGADPGVVDLIWITNVPSTITVDYGVTAAYELGSGTDGQSNTYHKVRLTGIDVSAGSLFVRGHFTGGDGTARTSVAVLSLSEVWSQ